jgi:radical SAM protein with 4Fe4S-binding SPASM domain
MNRAELINLYLSKFDVIDIVDLDQYANEQFFKFHYELPQKLNELYRTAYTDQQRLLFTLDRKNFTDHTCRDLLVNLQMYINKADISNYFVEILIDDQTTTAELESCIGKISIDPVPIKITTYHVDDRAIKSSTAHNKDFLLNTSKVFCMYPWTHLYVHPTGEIGPCCASERWVGNLKQNTLQEIWNHPPMTDLRLSMLSESSASACKRCYELEAAGAGSLRLQANKTFAHHIDLIDQTNADGTVDQFRMLRWDVRFNNLCNLKCRICHHVCSSSWHQDLAKLDPEWAKENPKSFLFAGRHETDTWEQVLPHLDHAEEIYFAGGEPLMMQEHFDILNELEKRQRFDVKLFYNTNFTHVQLKNRDVFDYWKKFKNVEVAASLDGSGTRGEYMRKGTDWDTVIANRRRMMEVCPNVTFRVSATASILNVLHLPDFHKEWVELGLISPEEFFVGLLKDPLYYRVDAANQAMKDQVNEKYQQHLAWLKPLDTLGRATNGFRSVLNFMNKTDNTQLLPEFWNKTEQLDQLRNESVLQIIPELEILTNENSTR